MNNMITVEHVSKSYAEFGLKDVSIHVPKGNIVGLVGENGAGKTTLMKAMLGVIKLDEGNVTLLGETPSDKNVQLRNRIGVVFSEFSFYQTLNVQQVGKIMAGVYANWNQAVFDQYINTYQISLTKKVKDFSTGTKMKLAIFLALAQQPELLILDEPTSGLDPVSREDILDLLLDFVQDENHSILFSSHITSDLEKIADHIIFLHQGEVLFQMEKDKLLYDYGILRCPKELYHQIEAKDKLKVREEAYHWDIMVENPKRIKETYAHLGELVVDPMKIDDMMVLCVKGEQ